MCAGTPSPGARVCRRSTGTRWTMPTFRAEDMSLAVVEARGHEKDTGGLSFRFGVLQGHGVLVEYHCDGLSARQVWELVQETSGLEKG